jgi:hypothetical protein
VAEHRNPDRTTIVEELRLDEAREKGVPWKQWGPYLSERQWGTVREDYSDNGNAWNYSTHDQARSRAYHWGEDGLAGFSDDHQRMCFALALWNGKDPILKERLFGLTNSEGNHGEDVLRLPDGNATRLKVRSMVGLLPLCAVTAVDKQQRERTPRLTAQMIERVRRMPELFESIHPTGPGHLGVAARGILGLVNQDRLRRILTRMLDENEFLSAYGIRLLSRYHAEHPYVFSVGGQEYRVGYLPAESDTGMFGGNSNWRGPIWMPVNALLIRALMHYYAYYGDNFKIECPTGSGKLMNLFEVAREIANRLTRAFLRDDAGRRPVFGGAEKFQRDPHWRDHLLFYEYFHGDNGTDLGASHQTGWTGGVALMIEIFGKLDAQTFLQGGREATFGPEKEAV